MVERGGVVAGFLSRPSKPELQVQPVLDAAFRVGQLRTHCRFLIGGERGGLQIGKAPIGFAEAGRQSDAAIVGGNRIVGASGSLERDAIVQPYVRLIRMLP